MTRRIASILIFCHVALLLVSGWNYYRIEGDLTDAPRMVIRIVGGSLIVWGIWKGFGWAWWVGVIFTGLLSVVGTAGLYIGLLGRVFQTRPTPNLDLGIYIGLIVCLAGAFVLLLLPSSRKIETGGKK